MDIKCGHFKSSGSAVNVLLGWVPDFIWLLYDVEGSTAEVIHMWNRVVEDLGATGQYGWNIDAAGVITANASGSGITSYNDSGEYVMVRSPIPEMGKKATVVQTWAVGITPVARAATVIGTILRPTVKNGYVYEDTTGTTITATEPVWPTTPGKTVSIDSNTWTCREEEVVRHGGQGFTVEATIQTNDEYIAFIAFKADKFKDVGDADVGELEVV